MIEMRSSALTSHALPASAPAAARAVFRLMKSLRHGSLDVQLPDGSVMHFGDASVGAPRAAMRLLNWNVCGATLRSGDIGFAEAFIAGDWSSPDPAALKNIHAHYDLGNEFYRLWLDPTMNYSSAWFEGERSRPMAEAQWAKVRRALVECELKAGDRVLEIGCGWGALAECAAREFSATVTGVTLSTEQLAWARERLATAGLPGDMRLQDYRDLKVGPGDGPFDAVASIEMFEAVGREYWPSFFQTLKAQLKAGGKACVQSIVIRDDMFERYVNSTDFIQQYIFPGGLLPSPSEFRKAAQAAGLRVVNELAFGLDYAETLSRWRERFLSQEGPVRQLGFDTRFMRIWEFYLAYCEAAFAMGNTDVMQFTLQHD
jgi:cyclopropane-fatty-acyl-phospholipid synthase